MTKKGNQLESVKHSPVICEIIPHGIFSGNGMQSVKILQWQFPEVMLWDPNIVWNNRTPCLLGGLAA